MAGPELTQSGAQGGQHLLRYRYGATCSGRQPDSYLWLMFFSAKFSFKPNLPSTHGLGSDTLLIGDPMKLDPKR